MATAATGRMSRHAVLFFVGALIQSLIAVVAWMLNNPVIVLGGFVILLFVAAIIIDYRAVFIAIAFITFGIHADITSKLFVIPAIGLNLYAMDFILLAAICVWFTQKGIGFRMPWKSSRLTLTLTIFLCSLPFFIGVGISHGISLKNALADLRLFGYYMIYFVVLGLVRTRKDLHVLFWATILLGMFGMITEIAYSLSTVGYDSDTGKAVFFQRITGSQEGTFPMLFIASAAMLPFVRTTEKRATLIVCNFLSIVALFLSLTRGSWVAAIAASAVLVICLYMYVPKTRAFFKALFVGALIVGCAIYILSLFELLSFNLYFLRLSILSPKRLDTSTLIRFTEWQMAFNIFLSHPWTGIGLGYIYKYFAIGYGNVSQTFIHNSYLYVASKMGVIGLALFLSVFGTAVVVWMRLLPRQNKSEDLGLTLAFGLMLIVMIVKAFTTWQLNDIALSLYVGTLLGAVGVIDFSTRKDGAA